MGIEMLLLATTALSAASSVKSGQQKKKSADMQAQQAGLQATADITDRTRALNEALATQNAMMGASGRTGESIKPLIAGQEKRFKEDADLISKGASAQASQYKMAGQAEQTNGYVNAASTVGSGAYQYSMLK